MFRDNAQQQLTEKAQCRAQLGWALHQLNAHPSLPEVERCARLIWSTVSRHTRLFHNADHVLRLSEGGDALHTLAALFHDAVYVQVDDGLEPAVHDVLKPYLLQRNSQLYLQGVSAFQRKRSSALVAHLFGYQNVTPQLASLHNELSSALLAVCCLESFLDLGQLAQIVVAIEASIPFRGRLGAPADVSPSELLWQRLRSANQLFELGLDDATIVRAIHRAVAFANRDVESFATADPAIFLDKTWLLLPEFNPALRDPMHYSVQDYRKALERMEAFLQDLKAGSVFQQFRNYPDNATCQSWERRAQQNLSVAQLYLKTKIVAIALLEALVPYYQGEGSMAEWMACHFSDPPWAEIFGRWNLSHPLKTVTQSQVLQVAEQGRHGVCNFDLKQSPLAAFLIRAVGFERIDQLRHQANALFEERIGPEEFLGQCEAKVVQAITRRLQPLS